MSTRREETRMTELEEQRKELDSLYSEFESQLKEAAPDEGIPEPTETQPETDDEAQAQAEGTQDAEPSEEAATGSTEETPAVKTKPEGEKKIVVDNEPDEVEIWKKRYKDIQSWDTKISQENAMLKKQKEELEAKLKAFTEKLQQAPPQPTEAQKKFAEEYPELMGVLTPALQEMLEANVMPIKEQMDALKREKEELAQTLAIQEQVALRNQIVAVHDDFDEIRSSKYFHEWLQSDGMGPNDLSAAQKQAVLQSNSPKDAVRLLTQFKEEFKRNILSKQKPPAEKPPETTPKQAAQAMSDPKSGGDKVASMPVRQKKLFDLDKVDNMSIDDFAKKRDALWEQAQEALKKSALV